MGGVRYAAPKVLRGWKEAAGRGDRGGDGSLLLLDFGDEPGDGAGEDPGGAWAELGIGTDGVVRLRAATAENPALYPEDVLERGPWQPVPASARSRGGGRLSFGGPDAPVWLEIEANPFTIRLRGRHRVPICQLGGLRFADTGATLIALEVAAEERFFGFGAQRFRPKKTGALDQRGRMIVISDHPASLPYFMVHRTEREGPGCYGVLLDVVSNCRFDVAKTEQDQLVMETDGALDLTIFPGPTPRDVTRRFTERVGRTPLPPLWALGHHLVYTGTRGEKQVRSLSRKLQQRDLPTDAIHLNANHLDNAQPFTWHPHRYPDPEGLVHALASDGLRLVCLTPPGIRTDPESSLFASGSAHGVFSRRGGGELSSSPPASGERALPNFHRADVRSWWARQHAPLLQSGIAGIWNDMNQPAGWRQKLGRFARSQREPDLLAPGPDPEHPISVAALRSLYEQQQARATREALETFGRERRPFVLTDAASPGSHRYAALCTSGSRSRWADLQSVIPMLLGLGVSGAAFCGSEIGGHYGPCTPELYARWMQIGALSPLARTARHSGRQAPWRFGARAEAIAREALRLRMRLLPYLYALLRHSEGSGAPVWRSLAHEFPHDGEAADIDDQFLIGPALLAAPVLTRGATLREVYLPEGDWIDWHEGARYAGSRRLRVAAPLERMPLFVRGGSVIPTRRSVRNTGALALEPLILEVFPGGDASLELVEDDGETVAYQGGVSARTPLRLWSRAGGRLRLEIGRRAGPYAVKPRPLHICVHACPTPNAVYLDGELAEGPQTPGWQHDSAGRLHVRLRDEGAGCAIEVDPAP